MKNIDMNQSVVTGSDCLDKGLIVLHKSIPSSQKVESWQK